MPKFRFQTACFIAINLISAFESLLAEDIYEFLQKGSLTYIEHVGTSADLNCSYTFDLFDESDRPAIFFVPAEKVEMNKLSVLWELRELPEFLEGSTWENRVIISGPELTSLLIKFPQYRRDWHFHSQDRLNLKAYLTSISGYPLSINGEIHLILNFTVASRPKELTGGILSSKRLTGVTEFKITEESSEEKITLVSKFINEADIFKGPLKTVYRFGTNVLHVQWQDEKIEHKFKRPYPILLAVAEKNLYLYRDIGTISSFEMSSGEYSETLEYVAAYDINGDKLPETQHRYLGRYSAGDSFSSFTKEGKINCGGMTLGSD